MKTKEEILDKHYQPKMHWRLVNRANVLKAMEEYLQQNVASFISSNPLVIKSVCDCGSKYAINVAHKWFCEKCSKEVEMKQTVL